MYEYLRLSQLQEALANKRLSNQMPLNSIHNAKIPTVLKIKSPPTNVSSLVLLRRKFITTEAMKPTATIITMGMVIDDPRL